MVDIFEDLEEFIWTLGESDEILGVLENRYPNAKFVINWAKPLNLPENVITCCPTGAGEVVPVKRLTMCSARAGGNILLDATLEQIWTSPFAKVGDSRSGDFIFWDKVADEEVFLQDI